MNNAPGGHLARYLYSFPDIPGFFTKDAMVCWDFLLRVQESLGVTGDFLEIGVYKGRSAVLGAMYLRLQDWCVLIDINSVPEAEMMIRSFRPDRNRFLQCPSTKAGEAVGEHFGKCRWVHVDGDHKGSSVTEDLRLAAELICPDGVICVDDFFSFRYPQLTAAVYRFLFERPELQIFFAGSNKGYLCRSDMFFRYDDAIRNGFVSAIDDYGLEMQLNRTSYTTDGGHFTISWKEGDRKVIGLDESCDTIPH